MKVTQVALRPTPASDAAGRPALTPELLAASGARYSRSNEGLEAILSRIYLIYALCDPITGDVRYVGITSGSLPKRLGKHLWAARQGQRLYCSNWIRSLLEKNLKPLIKRVEETTDSDREAFWIEHYKNLGCTLTNLTSGGLSTFEHTQETREKISAAAEKHYKDLSGQTIGRLKVISIAGHRPLQWNCLCACGKAKIVSAQSFSAKGVKSCGCLARELAAERTRSRAKHGLWQSKEYLTWIEMRARCNNPNHARYDCNGALGIAVCAQWQQSFEKFFADMGPKPENHVILRENLGENYCPDNCRWATKSELRSRKR